MLHYVHYITQQETGQNNSDVIKSLSFSLRKDEQVHRPEGVYAYTSFTLDHKAFPSPFTLSHNVPCIIDFARSPTGTQESESTSACGTFSLLLYPPWEHTVPPSGPQNVLESGEMVQMGVNPSL